MKAAIELLQPQYNHVKYMAESGTEVLGKNYSQEAFEIAQALTILGVPTPPPFQPHQRRVVGEKEKLEENISKLAAFFDTDVFANLPEDHRDAMNDQHDAMLLYAAALEKRIGLF